MAFSKAVVTALVIVGIVAACVIGAIVGGLIGHFATKGRQYGPTPAPQVNPNSPQTSRDDQNTQKIIEKTSADEIKANLRHLSEKPHLAGSDRNNELADWIENKWKSYGFKTRQDEYNVLLSYPGNATNRNQAFVIDDQGNTLVAGQTEEEKLDPDQEDADVVPPFNAYAKSGTVQSNKVYYANYGRVEDFAYLTQNLGLNLTGSIIICRYGKIFRGNKVEFAQQYGALGVILYNDPIDYVDKSLTNSTFPNSWFLPPTGAQRGSLAKVKGDKLTEGYPAKDYAYRKTVDMIREEGIIPNIPTQPMGYGDAEKFLKYIAESNSAEVPQDWIGGINVTYKLGGALPNNRMFKIVNNNEDVMKPIRNVIGVIEGAEEPDRYVIVGNHRDAWMFGATDAGSGTSTMMEMSRVFGELMKEGWRPRRTIIFASWGGEEYGIIGSIEWLDDVRTQMLERAVAYINCDTGVVYNQLLVIGSSPLLFDSAYKTARKIPYPEDHPSYKTLYDAWYEMTADKTKPNSLPKIDDLGSGSDHTGFYHRLGIASSDISYYYDKKKIKINDHYPLYHTTYETFRMVENFVDKNFVYHRAIAQLWGEWTRLLADSVMIPFVTKDYANRLQQVYEVLNTAVRPDINARDPSMTVFLDNLKRAIDKFSDIAEDFDTRVKNVDYNNWSQVRYLNDQLFLLERSFTYPLGILDRKYIRHVIFAPSASNSYASSAFPGIGDSLFAAKSASMANEDAAWWRVQEELTKAIYSVESAAKFLDNVIGSL